MSAGEAIRCPACHRPYRWTSALAGHKFKCKCGAVIRAPVAAGGEVQLVRVEPVAATAVGATTAVATAKARAAPPAAPVAAAPSSGASCPSCAAAIKPGAAICIRCGYDLKAGRQLTTAVAASASAPPTVPGPLRHPRGGPATAPMYAKDGWLAPETPLNKGGAMLMVLPAVIAATSLWQLGVPLPILFTLVLICGVAGGILDVLNRGPLWAGGVIGAVMAAGGFGVPWLWIVYREGDVAWYQTTLAFIAGILPGALLHFVLSRALRPKDVAGVAVATAAPVAAPTGPADTTAMTVVRVTGFTCNGLMLLLGVNAVIANEYCGITGFFIAGLYNLYALYKGTLDGAVNKVTAIIVNAMALMIALIAVGTGIAVLTGAMVLPMEFVAQIPVPPVLIGALGLVMIGIGAIIIAASVCTLVYVLTRGARANES